MRSRYFKTIIGVILVIGVITGMSIGISSYVDNLVPTIIFNTNGGSQIDNIAVESGNVVLLPVPEKEGYDFLGWFYDRQLSEPVQSTAVSMPSNKLYLYASWDLKSFVFTVNQLASGATTPTTRVYTKHYGDQVLLSDYLKRTIQTGYNFIWQDSNHEVIDTSDTITVTSNLTYTQNREAKEYTIKYVYLDEQDNEQIITTDTKEFLDTVSTVGVDSSREGYTFQNIWIFGNDESVTDSFTINSNTYGVYGTEIVLYGKYNIKQYNLNFCKEDLENPLIPFTISYLSLIPLEYVSSVGQDAKFIKPFYDLVGWSLQGVRIDFSTFTMPSHHVSLYPIYELQSYSLEYYCNYQGEEVTIMSDNFVYDSDISTFIPTNEQVVEATSDAYRLLYFIYDGIEYTANELALVFSSPAFVIEGDIRIEVVIEKFLFLIQYYTTQDYKYYEVSVQKNELVELPDIDPDDSYAPYTAGQSGEFLFGGWSVDDEEFNEEYDLTNIEDDVIVYADWYLRNADEWSTTSIAGKLYLKEYIGTYNKVALPYSKDGILIYGIGTQYSTAVPGLENKSIIINNKIRDIREKAFYNTQGLKVLFEEDDIDSESLTIGMNAFGSPTESEQYSVKKLSLPARVDNIHNNAFLNARQLSFIEVDEDCANYYSIDGVLYSRLNGEQTLFYYPNARSGESFVIPSNITAIGDYAFQYNGDQISNATYKSLLHLSLESGSLLETIGDYAFYGNKTLQTVDFRNSTSIEGIGDFAFFNCFATERTDGGHNAFQIDAINLTSVGNNSFENTYFLYELNFENINILSSIGESAFHNLGYGITEWSPIYSTLSIGLDITTIANSAFSKARINLVFADDMQITSIGDNAFEEATLPNLKIATDVVVGFASFKGAIVGTLEFDCITSLGENAFELLIQDNEEGFLKLNVISLVTRYSLTGARITNLYLDGVDTLFVEEAGKLITPFTNDTTFSQIKNITFGSNCTFDNIPSYLFGYSNSVTYLENVVLCNSIKTINFFGFLDANKLKSIVLPDNLTTLGQLAFGKCSSLENIVVTADVINNKVFEECTSLKSAIINVKEKILDQIFKDCTALESVVIRSTGSATVYQDSLFYNCTSLQYVVLINDSLIAQMKPTTAGYNLMTNAPIGATIYVEDTELDDYQYVINEDLDYCWTSLLSRMVGVTITGDDFAVTTSGMLLKYFGQGNSVDVDLPASVTSIGRMAFYGLGIENFSITISSATMVTLVDEIDLFTNTGLVSLDVYLPSALFDTYKEDDKWTNYMEYFQEIV